VQIWSALVVASLLAGTLVYLMTVLERRVQNRMGVQV